MRNVPANVAVGVLPWQTVRFKNELERNITIKLGYANAKIFKAVEGAVPGPGNFRYDEEP